ncbi:ankyrin, partial [Lepidopterella palustris CBS 459.81]
GRTALSLAIEKSFHGIIELILNSPTDIRLNELHGGCSLLFLAIESGNTPLVKRLLYLGADPRIRTQFQETVFHASAYSEDFDLFQLMVNTVGEEDVHAADYDQETPLHIAARLDCFNIFESLLALRAPIDAVSIHGATPLTEAAK